MFRSYWLTIGKVAGLGLLIFAAYGFYSSLSWHSTALENEAAQRTKIHGQNAENRIERVCISPLAKPDCVEDAKQAQRENEREEQDLAAQKVTAWWTKVMGIAALIGMALSAVGVWLVRETFIATVDTNKITQKQLDDARLMARPIMDIAVRLATTPESWPPYSHYLRMSIGITNRGNTEARDVSIVNATVKLTNRRKAKSFYDTAEAKGRDIYGNGASATVELDPMETVFLKDIMFAKGKTAIIALEYSYRDVFGNKVTLSEQLEGAWVMDDSSATCAAAQKIPKN